MCVLGFGGSGYSGGFRVQGVSDLGFHNSCFNIVLSLVFLSLRNSGGT